jgi:hypothetical protein
VGIAEGQGFSAEWLSRYGTDRKRPAGSRSGITSAMKVANCSRAGVSQFSSEMRFFTFQLCWHIFIMQVLLVRKSTILANDF